MAQNGSVRTSALDRGIIPIGRENAITRRDLAAQMGLSDRAARDTVAKLRKMETDDPYVICSSSTSPPGYWRTDDQREIDRYKAECRNRAESALELLEDAKRFERLKENGNSSK